MVARVRKGDVVKVLSGKDKGKQGSVLMISPKKDKVLVKDVAVVTRHMKPRRQGEPGTIQKKESYIMLSKVMPVCGSCNKPCRINTKLLDEGKRVRLCNKCKEIF